MHNTIIQYHPRDVFGRTMMFPNDETVERALLLFNGQKTLTPSTMEALELLGFKLEETVRPSK